MWAGKMFGKSYKGRVHGSDLVDKLSSAIAKKPIRVGFLGGYGNVAQLSAECLVKKYPGLKVAFASEEWDKDVAKKDCDILFVAFGSPKQEKWIYENLPNINVRVAIGVGGAFDFISGKVRRAPVWIRKIGLEWLFRLIIQPWRIKRQLSLPKFVILVLKERFQA
ncbi:MAG: WecB/TagA/CpsF family glycosyltransferase [Bacteriovoracales bacterium]